jgi:hypothetical protein
VTAAIEIDVMHDGSAWLRDHQITPTRAAAYVQHAVADVLDRLGIHPSTAITFRRLGRATRSVRLDRLLAEGKKSAPTKG